MREQGVQAKFFSGDCIVNEEMVTAAGGAQYTNGIYMTFGKDPRLILTEKPSSRNSAPVNLNQKDTPSTPTRLCRLSQRHSRPRKGRIPQSQRVAEG